jgi:hypothetical protein
VFWYSALLKIESKTGVIWRNVYVLSYYYGTLLLLEIVANDKGEGTKKNRVTSKNHQPKQPKQPKQPHSHNKEES